jgi:hypothetical protein
MFEINVSQMADLLDIYNYSLYARIKTLFPDYEKEEYTKEYKIDFDQFLIDHKVYNFLFDYEVKNTSFSERLIAYNYPDTIDAKMAKEILNLQSDYELRKIRIRNEIKAKQINETRYVYDTNSVLKKAAKMGIMSHYYKYSKQFYKPADVIAILNNIGFSMNTRALYRYINEYKNVPCIKVGGALRIPQLEFEDNVLPYAKDIFKNFINH